MREHRAGPALDHREGAVEQVGQRHRSQRDRQAGRGADGPRRAVGRRRRSRRRRRTRADRGPAPPRPSARACCREPPSPVVPRTVPSVSPTRPSTGPDDSGAHCYRSPWPTRRRAARDRSGPDWPGGRLRGIDLRRRLRRGLRPLVPRRHRHRRPASRRLADAGRPAGRDAVLELGRRHRPARPPARRRAGLAVTGVDASTDDAGRAAPTSRAPTAIDVVARRHGRPRRRCSARSAATSRRRSPWPSPPTTRCSTCRAPRRQRALRRRPSADGSAPGGRLVVEGFVPADDPDGAARRRRRQPHGGRRARAHAPPCTTPTPRPSPASTCRSPTAGVRLRPVAGALPAAGPARRARRRRPASSSSTAGPTGSGPPFDDTARCTSRSTVERREPAPPQPAQRPLGHRRHRAGHPAGRLRAPPAAGRDRAEPPVPVLPRPRGGHAAGARDLRPRRLVAGAGRAQPLPRVLRAPGEMEVTRIGPVFVQAPANGIHEVLVLTPEPRHRLGRARRQGRRARDGRHPRPARGPRPRARTSATPRPSSTTAARPGRRSSTRTASCSASRSCPTSCTTSSTASAASRPPTATGSAPTSSRPTPTSACCAGWSTIEREAGHRLVVDDERVAVVCPFWSGSPYEMLVVPTDHEGHLARAMPRRPGGRRSGPARRAGPPAAARRRRRLQRRVPHRARTTTTRASTGTSTWSPASSSVAGFEQGTGVRINIVAPEAAAAAAPLDLPSTPQSRRLRARRASQRSVGRRRRAVASSA